MPGPSSANRLARRPEGAAFVRAVLRWFEDHRRPLPFRGDPDPWRVLVSECMLQQTRVEAMLPRYRAFVARFPDPASFAAVPEDEAVAAWAGLGYYRRARHLHRAAGRISRTGFPRTAARLRTLPGVGPYTAAAVASIAFGEPVAAVDANVRRVLARWFAVEGPPDRAPFRARIRRLADRLVEVASSGRTPATSAGNWNQALMELGALVCTPSAPRCGGCPLRGGCLARREDRVAVLPEPRRRQPAVRVRLATALVRDARGRILLFRRRRSPLRGLYELPAARCRAGETPERALRRGAASRYGLRLRPERALSPFRHAVMEQRITVYPFVAAVTGGGPEARGGPRARGRWTAPGELDRIPAGAIVRKTLGHAAEAAR